MSGGDKPDRFEGTHPDPVQEGNSLTIEFDNPDLAGQTVTVQAFPAGGGDGVNIQIDLDTDGKGTTEWTVPTGWAPALTLEHPTSRDHGVDVES